MGSVTRSRPPVHLRWYNCTRNTSNASESEDVPRLTGCISGLALIFDMVRPFNAKLLARRYQTLSDGFGVRSKFRMTEMRRLPMNLPGSGA